MKSKQPNVSPDTQLPDPPSPVAEDYASDVGSQSSLPVSSETLHHEYDESGNRLYGDFDLFADRGGELIPHPMVTRAALDAYHSHKIGLHSGGRDDLVFKMETLSRGNLFQKIERHSHKVQKHLHKLANLCSSPSKRQEICWNFVREYERCVHPLSSRGRDNMYKTFNCMAALTLQNELRNCHVTAKHVHRIGGCPSMKIPRNVKGGARNAYEYIEDAYVVPVEDIVGSAVFQSDNE